MRDITSRQNPIFKQLRAVAQESGRMAKDKIFLEGKRLCLDAMQSGLSPEILVVSEHARSETVAVLTACAEEITAQIRVPDSLFSLLSQTTASQGVGCVFSHPEARSLPETIVENARFLLLEEVQDPGNVGTIVRTADAMGFSGILMTAGTADPYRSKAIRAAMGSTFHIPIYPVSDASAGIAWLRQAGCVIYAAHLAGESLRGLVWRYPAALLIGNEGVGLMDATTALADERVCIPMWGQAESLNVACATAILCYSIRIGAD